MGVLIPDLNLQFDCDKTQKKPHSNGEVSITMWLCPFIQTQAVSSSARGLAEGIFCGRDDSRHIRLGVDVIIGDAQF